MASQNASPKSTGYSSVTPSLMEAVGEGGVHGTTTTPGEVPPEVAFQFEFSGPPPPPDPNSRPSTPSSRPIDNLTWDDIQINDQGDPTGCLGVPFVALTSKQLRSVCSRLEIRGVKNVNKDLMIARIIAQFKNRAAYAALGTLAVAPSDSADVSSPSSNPRREMQCPFRLMNVLFSDMFAERFANTGNVASRQLLDTRLAGSTQIVARLSSPGDSSLTEQSGRKRKTSNPIAVAITKLADAETQKTDVARSRVKFFDDENARREEQRKMKEWGMIAENLRKIRQELKDPTLDEDERNDLKCDLERLKKRKNTLADGLGWAFDQPRTT